MNTFTKAASRRITAFASTAAIAVAALTMTVAAQPASAIQEPVSERPCFIVQPRWNTAIDGPPPTCSSYPRQQPAPSSGVWSAPRPGVDAVP
jgi:hypothetical protein